MLKSYLRQEKNYRKAGYRLVYRIGKVLDKTYSLLEAHTGLAQNKNYSLNHSQHFQIHSLSFVKKYVELCNCKFQRKETGIYDSICITSVSLMLRTYIETVYV
jgi:hypothetical protein